MNTKNGKTNEPNRFKYDLIDKLDLRNPNKWHLLHLEKCKINL